MKKEIWDCIVMTGLSELKLIAWVSGPNVTDQACRACEVSKGLRLLEVVSLSSMATAWTQAWACMPE